MSTLDNDIQTNNNLNFIRDSENYDLKLTEDWENKALYIYLEKQTELLIESLINYENPNIIKSILSQKIIEKSAELGINFDLIPSIINNNPKLYNIITRGKNER